MDILHRLGAVGWRYEMERESTVFRSISYLYSSTNSTGCNVRQDQPPMAWVTFARLNYTYLESCSSPRGKTTAFKIDRVWMPNEWDADAAKTPEYLNWVCPEPVIGVMECCPGA